MGAGTIAGILNSLSMATIPFASEIGDASHGDKSTYEICLYGGYLLAYGTRIPSNWLGIFTEEFHRDHKGYRSPMSGMTQVAIDIADDTYIVANISRVSAVFRDEARWRTWWPDRLLTVYNDRGEKGLRWTVTGEFIGSSEVWLEQAHAGVIVHYYLRVDPTVEGSTTQRREFTGSPRAQRYVSKIRHRQVTSWKKIIWQIKDDLELGANHSRPGVA